ncbi:MAG: hypothetical protein KHX46_08875, partial [Clostridiales bacterium]|nr:hypothetical protein [Clostridiales bacterium]
MRRSVFSFPLPGCRAAVPFGQSPKRHQKRFCSPAPSENTCGGVRLLGVDPKATCKNIDIFYIHFTHRI